MFKATPVESRVRTDDRADRSLRRVAAQPEHRGSEVAQRILLAEKAEARELPRTAVNGNIESHDLSESRL
jgi:hypothetical protein